MRKFLSGLVIVLIVLVLQFQFVAGGVRLNPALAVLIAFAFTFELFDLILIDLLAVFLINWRPGINPALIAFALIPLIVFAIRKLIPTDPWLGATIAIVCGLFAWHLVVAPSFFLASFGFFVVDLIVGLAVGELSFFLVS